jgi:ribonuclease BN (tRNA processing enzyme)
VELQVLGSGGPELEDGRSSSAYVVWLDGKARVLVDFGSGAKLRWGQSGALFEDLDAVLFTHLHVDHCGDFPGLVKGAYFEDRRAPLPVLGPPGNEDFPSIVEFVAALLDPKHGAFRYLSEYAAPSNKEHVVFLPRAVASPDGGIVDAMATSHAQIRAVPVVHGNVPALAWRVEVAHRSLVFSGDTNAEGDALPTLARDANLLVAHNAVREGATSRLHMTPTRIGQVASGARVKALVISHRRLATLGSESETEAAIRSSYPGPLTFADDLDCFAVP